MTLTDGRPTVSSPGARIPASEVDFRVRYEGTLVLLWAVSDDAVGWVDEYLPEDCTRWASAYVIEARYAGAIFDGIDNDGLTVGRAA